MRETRTRKAIEGNEREFTKYVNEDPDSFEIKETDYAGKGLFAKKDFKKNDFLLNYRGKLASGGEDGPGEYIFQFDEPKTKVTYTIDATEENSGLARFINDIDSIRKKPNVIVKCLAANEPVLALYALNDIASGKHYNSLFEVLK
jgi:hypothetical protein